MTKATKITTLIVIATALVGLSLNAPTNTDNNSTLSRKDLPSSTSETKTTQTPQESPIPIVRIEEERITTPIPFITTTVDDSSLALGTTSIKTKGQNGEKVEVYEVAYTDQKETSRELIETIITKEPVSEVILNGTYVAPTKPSQPTQPTGCTNGTYINSAGNTVCRPSETNSGGATAICKDGTYSYSQSRRGTCSGHGGVRRWL